MSFWFLPLMAMPVNKSATSSFFKASTALSLSMPDTSPFREGFISRSWSTISGVSLLAGLLPPASVSLLPPARTFFNFDLLDLFFLDFVWPGSSFLSSSSEASPSSFEATLETSACSFGLALESWASFEPAFFIYFCNDYFVACSAHQS